MVSNIIQSEDERCPHCGRPIQYGHVEALGTVSNIRLECECISEKKAAEREKSIKEGRERLRLRMRREVGLSKRAIDQRFRNFIPKEGQNEALEKAKAFAKGYINQKNDGNGLLLIGGVGSGKTHLAAAIVNAIIDHFHISDDRAEEAGRYGDCGLVVSNFHWADIEFIGAVSLMERLRSSYDSNENTCDIIEQYQKTALLVLDDIGAEKPSDWTRERLFDIIDYRYNEYLPVVITTNSDIKEMRTKLGDRICDRIRSMCDICTVTAKSQRKTAKS